MAASIEITAQNLVVQIEGADRLWALKSRLEIPLDHVTGARAASDEAREWIHGLRLGGAHIPGVFSAGHFYHDGEHVFWDVHHPEKAIAIELRDDRYGHLVLEVADPSEAIARISHALAGVTT